MTVDVLLHNPKFPHNVGAALRAMSCFGTGGTLAWTGDRWSIDDLPRLPREERMKAYEDIEWVHHTGPRPIDFLAEARLIRQIVDGGDTPSPVVPVAVELLPSSEPLHQFEHPENAIYIFGPEDGSLPAGIRSACHRFVTIPSAHCLNLAAAVYVTLYDRLVKRCAAKLDPMPTLDEDRGYWWHSPAYEEPA